jgi:hypothetical protein
MLVLWQRLVAIDTSTSTTTTTIIVVVAVIVVVAFIQSIKTNILGYQILHYK